MALNGKRVVAVVEARMTSTRLPGKVLLPAGGCPLLEILCRRLRRAPRVDEVVIATTTNKEDNPIVALAGEVGISVWRGSEHDVLKRVVECLRAYDAEICVEVTGDCPLVDPVLVEEVLEAMLVPGRIYVSNSDPCRAVPAGLDVQAFLVSALEQIDAETADPLDREHVSYGFYRPESQDRWNPFFVQHELTRGAEHLWVSLDHREDYELIRALHEDLSMRDPEYGATEIIAWVRDHPELHQKCLDLRPGWGR